MNILFLTERELTEMSEAEAYKPVHGGYPTYTKPPSNPIPGSEWNGDREEETIYFEATKLSEVLDQIAHDAQAKAWKLTSALRNMRLAETTGMINTELAVIKLYHEYMQNADVDLKVRLLVNELANTIELDKERPQSKIAGNVTIYPSMDRYYALRPVWEFINNVRQAFKQGI